MVADDRKERLRRVVEEILERRETDGDAAVERACRDNPDLAASIRGRLRTLRDMGLLEGAGGQDVPERLGEFRLLRSLGAGGMGVVYLAEQESLRRPVALKLIRPEHVYFEGARERFQREALAAARLQHPAIVPVLTVGEEGGVPYFAMEYVEGCSLADALARLRGRDPRELRGADLGDAVLAAREDGGQNADRAPPDFGRSWVDACFRVALAIAEALAHAHERGVLHRDVKPGNIMLTLDGRARLVDFGLASVPGSKNLTRSRSRIGSLLYMAPEVLRGDVRAADERADVYGLGATLYEMLTFSPPHDAMSEERLMFKVAGEPPIRPRRRNPALPADAETVCLKAIELDPKHRYASARDFARDLHNVVELRPIEAVRPGPITRARRFARRRPAAALAAFLGLLIVAGGPVAYVLFQTRAQRALARAFEQTELERARAESYLKRAFDAIDRTLLRLGETAFSGGLLPGRDQLAVFDEALSLFSAFEAENAGGERLRRMVAQCRRRSAQILAALDRLEEAESSADAAIHDYDELLRESPDDPELLYGSGIAYETRAVSRARRGLVEPAIEDWKAATRRYDRALSSRPADPLPSGRYASTAGSMAIHLVNLGRAEEAIDLVERAVALVRAAEAVADDPALLARPHTSALVNGSRAYLARGDVPRALEMLHEATRVALAGHRDRPDDVEILDVLAAAYASVGAVLSDEQRLREAEQNMSEAVSLLRELSARFPDQPTPRRRLARALGHAGAILRRLGRLDEAEAHLAEALDIRRALAREHPGVPEYAWAPAMTLGEIGDVRRARGDAGGARGALTEAIAILQSSGPAATDPVQYHRNLGIDWRSLAEISLDLDDPERAEREVGHAIEHFRASLEVNPRDEGEIGNLVAALLVRCSARARMGDALGLFEAAQELHAAAPDRQDGSEGAAAMALTAISLFDRDDAPPGAERAVARENMVSFAVECLRVAIERGFTARDELLEGPACEPVRDHPSFQALLRDGSW